MSEFTIGDWIEIRGVTAESHKRHNGKRGCIHGKAFTSQEGQAWDVKISDPATSSIVLFESEMQLIDWNVDKGAGTPDGEAGEAIISPIHYTGFTNGAEVIDLAEHLNFNRGCAVKYLCRAGRKDDELEDLLKALYYIKREIARMEVAS
ncbi:DUF3310 domain-containing protein [Streptomyces sp. NPDC057555]|uniref:DUF3310 domain-containing protein n=1 Tax=Streptomyces sp. NPDC057555 TaxID=3346166 RepID=UPI00369F319A